MRSAIAVLMLLLPLAGCLSGDQPVDDVGPAGSELPPGTPFAAYVHTVSEAVEGVVTLTEQYKTAVPTDSVEETIDLDTWIIRPDTDEPVPLILEVTPYYGGGAPASLGKVGEEFLARGYAVGVSSVRGTGNSGGCFTQGGVQEAKDTAAVIEDLAGEPWSNGNVGLMGVSYPGTTPQDVWVEAPPSLKAIVPISGISDLYKYNFVNGVPIDIQGLGFNTYYWAMVGLAPVGLSGGAQPTDVGSVPGAIAGEACEDQVEVQEGGVSSTRDGNKDAYWQERDFAAELAAAGPLPDGRQRAAIWYIHGLQDWNVKPHMMEGWLDAVWDEGVPTKVWLGQWGHAWPASTGSPCDDEGASCRADWWDLGVIAWFDQFLKEIDTGIMDAPPVQVQDDDGVWRSEQRWPAATSRITYAFDDGALTDTPGSGSASYQVFATDGVADGVAIGTSVSFVSQPLERDLHLSGMPVFRGEVTATADRASIVLSLGEQIGNGARYVNYAALSLNHAGGLEEGVPSVAGEVVPVELAFFPQEDVLHAGSRVVLTFAADVVGGGPAPGLIPVHENGSIHIDLATASLELPVDEELVFEAVQPYEI